MSLYKKVIYYSSTNLSEKKILDSPTIDGPTLIQKVGAGLASYQLASTEQLELVARIEGKPRTEPPPYNRGREEYMMDLKETRREKKMKLSWAVVFSFTNGHPIGTKKQGKQRGGIEKE